MSAGIEMAPRQEGSCRLLPRGLDSLITYVRGAERLSDEERQHAFQTLTKASDTGQIQNEKRRLVWSYMPLVLGRAIHAVHRNSTTLLEDCIQSGVEGLYEAIDDYQHASNDHAFALYATPAIDLAIRRQYFQDQFHTEVGSTLRAVIAQYIRAENTARQPGEDVVIDVSEIAEAASASREMALTGLLMMRSSMIRAKVTDNERPDATDIPVELRSKSSSAQLSPMLERTLLLLTPKRRRYIEHYYGLLADEPVLSLEEIREAEGLANTDAVRSLRNAGLRDMRKIIDYFLRYGTEFDQWPDKRFVKTLNVLTYLHRTGLPIPPEKSLEDLRVAAMQDLSKKGASDEHTRIIAEMYGLHSNEKKSVRQIAEERSTSDTRLLGIAKRVMSTVVTP